MDQREKNIQIADAIDNAKTIAVMLTKTPNVDAFSSAAGLYFLLKEKGKKVEFLYEGSIPEDVVQLINPTEIISSAGAKELVVSIDYSSSPEAVAQYSTNNGILYIKLAPVSREFDVNKVQTEIIGRNYDLIFTVGAETPENIGQLYVDLKADFARSRVVNVDNKESNLKYGFYNIVEPVETSLSLLVLNISRFWRLKVTPISAKALLKGISHGMA